MGQLRELLSRRADIATVVLLVASNRWSTASIAPELSFIYQRRGREGGTESFAHSWLHCNPCRHGSAFDRFFWDRRLTTGENEYVSLPHQHALIHTAARRRPLRNATGRVVAGFVATAWLYGVGARFVPVDTAFEPIGVNIHVQDRRPGRALAIGSVLTWPSRGRACITFSLRATAVLLPIRRRQRPVRISMHPSNTSEPAPLHSIGRSVERLFQMHRSARYAALLQDRRPR